MATYENIKPTEMQYHRLIGQDSEEGGVYNMTSKLRWYKCVVPDSPVGNNWQHNYNTLLMGDCK